MMIIIIINFQFEKIIKMDNDLHEKQIIKDIFQCEIKESSQTIQ